MDVSNNMKALMGRIQWITLRHDRAKKQQSKKRLLLEALGIGLQWGSLKHNGGGVLWLKEFDKGKRRRDSNFCISHKQARLLDKLLDQ